LFVSNSQVIGCEDRLRNDLYCVGWGIKLCSIQSKPMFAGEACDCGQHCVPFPSRLWRLSTPISSTQRSGTDVQPTRCQTQRSGQYITV